jgi:transposase
MRYELTDHERVAIKPMLPNKRRCIPRVNDRRVPNGMFWVLRSGHRGATCHVSLAPIPPATIASSAGVGLAYGVGSWSTSGRPQCSRPNDRHLYCARSSTRRKRPNCCAAANATTCHVWTAPAVQEENLTFQRAGRVQPCIRPLSTAAVAAGPDVIRGSGPNQKHAFLPRMAHKRVFPIDGLDRFASMSSSPLQFLKTH